MKIIVGFLLGFFTFSLYAASFDCAKALSRIENEICASSGISELDSQLAEIYSVVILKSADPDGVKAAQRSWLKLTRNQCQDTACFVSVYQQRIDDLAASIPKTAQNTIQNKANSDCTHELEKIDKIICSSRQLSKLDSDLIEAYKSASTRLEDYAGLKDAMNIWLKDTRNKCEDETCLIAVYIEKIASLNELKIVSQSNFVKKNEISNQSTEHVEIVPQTSRVALDMEDGKVAERVPVVKAKKMISAKEELIAEREAQQNTYKKIFVGATILFLLLFGGLLWLFFKYRKEEQSQVKVITNSSNHEDFKESSSKNFSTSKELSADELIKNKEQEENIEIKMKLDALRAGLNKKTNNQQENISKYNTVLINGLISSNAKFKKYMENKYYFYTSNDAVELKNIFKSLGRFLLNIKKLSLEKKLFLGVISLMAIGFFTKDEKIINKSNDEYGGRSFLSRTGELNYKIKNLKPGCPDYAVRQAYNSLLQAREILNHERHDTPSRASDLPANLGLSILKSYKCID